MSDLRARIDDPTTGWKGKGLWLSYSNYAAWHLAAGDHVYLLTLYRKGVKDDLTRHELAAWRKVVEDIEND